MESLIFVHHTEANKLADILQDKHISFSTKSADQEFEFYVSPSDLKKAEKITYSLFG